MDGTTSDYFFHSSHVTRFRSVVDRILDLRLTPSQRLVKREVSYEFMNRQMVWQAFTVCYGWFSASVMLIIRLGISRLCAPAV